MFHLISKHFIIGSPSREWTFIDKSDIAESAGAIGGAIPKKITPPSSAAPTDDTSNNNNKVDYAELSRLLSTHIVAQNQTTPSASIQSDGKAQCDVAVDAAKSVKTPPPTPMHPGMFFQSIEIYLKCNDLRLCRIVF